ncbi:putative transporter [Venturia nashicola]|uniref:Putative transporter n=1 Tax=Venturia nashicola TaxID=86259 RepID=A0A4Z1P9J9_9PEZI|nr:putative transporter [Venturia nashicola]
MSSKLVANFKQKHLLLTFDAFGTLYQPRTSIPATYARVAKEHGIQDVNEEELAVSFKKGTFKSASKQFPNYGKASGLRLHEWWAYLVRDSFQPVTSKPVPDAMIRSLMEDFSSKKAYRLFSDVLPFFTYLKDMNGSAQTPDWPWRSTTVGVITNSDFRVGGILKSLGLKVRDERNQESENLSPDISFVTTSYIAGIEKPDAKIFKAAQNTFSQLISSSEIPAEDIVKVHIGDDLEKDVFGAMGAGWTSIFLDRAGRFKDEKEEDKQKNLTVSVTHPVTQEEKEISVIKKLCGLRLKLSSTSF